MPGAVGGGGWPYNTNPYPPQAGGGSGGAGGGYGLPPGLPPPFPGLDDTEPGGGGSGSNALYERYKDDPNWHEGPGPYGWGTTPSGGGGYGKNGGATPPKPSELKLESTLDPRLEELVGMERGYLGDLKEGTGRIQDITAGRLRDVREGGRKAVQNSAAFRGVDDEHALTSYDAETARGEQSALADVATGREALMGSALQGALGIFAAPGQNALAQQANQIGAFQANNAANMEWWNATNMVGKQNFSNWMAILGLQNEMFRGGVPGAAAA